MSPVGPTMRHKHIETVLVPTPLRHVINYKPKANASERSTPRSLPAHALPPSEANKSPKSEERSKTTFRAVEGQLHRSLIQKGLKNKITASESNEWDLLDIPEIDFFCSRCLEPKRIPCRNRISCRTRCVLCCRCPIRRS
ncbi:hypothetical protein BG006_001038 [Podila minutissima]|uniref:Uncharacterized protein n=1 Tax=Podila minutissima TaxID=64525 RepID=A0A9P5SAK1_9FUNG|nr:hypothetical protein BG006_001038 [Podila minutissima]